MYSIVKKYRASVLYVLILAEDLDAPSLKLGRLTVGSRAFPLDNPVYTERMTVLLNKTLIKCVCIYGLILNIMYSRCRVLYNLQYVFSIILEFPLGIEH